MIYVDGCGSFGIIAVSALICGLGAFALIWFVIKKKSSADLVSVFVKTAN